MGFFTKLAIFVFTAMSVPKFLVRIITLAYGVFLAYRFDKWLSSKAAPAKTGQSSNHVGRLPTLKRFLPAGLSRTGGESKQIPSSEDRSRLG